MSKWHWKSLKKFRKESHTQVDAKLKRSSWRMAKSSRISWKSGKKTKPLSLNVFRILKRPWSSMICPVTLFTLVMTDAEMMENQVVFGFRGQTEARHRECPRFHQGLHRRQHLGTAFLPSNGRNLRSLWLWLSGFDAYETLPETVTPFETSKRWSNYLDEISEIAWFCRIDSQTSRRPTCDTHHPSSSSSSILIHVGAFSPNPERV